MTYTPEEWMKLATQVKDLIIAEIDNAKEHELRSSSGLGKLRIMIEFFSFIRGEAFESIKPISAPGMQDELYKMENELYPKLRELIVVAKENKVNTDSLKSYFRELEYIFEKDGLVS